MKNEIQVLNKPNTHIETMVYNKSKQLIAEIMTYDDYYIVEFFKMGNGGAYVREMPTYFTTTYACAFLAAKKYAETAETSSQGYTEMRTA